MTSLKYTQAQDRRGPRVRAMAGAALLAGLLAGCATVEEAAVEATTKTYHATLTGAQEPGGGDADGAGKAEVSVAKNLDQICYEVKGMTGLGTITMAHIHRGAVGENGPPVLTLKVANEGGFKGCDTAPEWLQDAIKSTAMVPGAFRCEPGWARKCDQKSILRLTP